MQLVITDKWGKNIYIVFKETLEREQIYSNYRNTVKRYTVITETRRADTLTET